MPESKMVFQRSEKPLKELGMGIFEKGRHVGFIYKREVSDAHHMLCHLTYDGVKNSTYTLHGKTRWTPSALDGVNQKYVCQALNRFTQYPDPENLKIPYGVSHLFEHFAEDGRYIPMPKGYGYTCVTFMLQFLMDNGYFSIAWDTWPDDRLKESEEVMTRHLKGKPKSFVENSRRARPEEAVVIFFKARKNSLITFPMIEPDSILAKKQIEKLWKRQINA